MPVIVTLNHPSRYLRGPRDAPTRSREAGHPLENRGMRAGALPGPTFRRHSLAIMVGPFGKGEPAEDHRVQVLTAMVLDCEVAKAKAGRTEARRSADYGIVRWSRS